jgi:hypothetical protein
MVHTREPDKEGKGKVKDILSTWQQVVFLLATAETHTAQFRASKNIKIGLYALLVRSEEAIYAAV